MALQEFSLNNEDLALTSVLDSASLLDSVKGLAQTKLQGFAQSQDFEDKIALAFGQGRSVDKFRSIWLTGKISFPAIEIRSKSELGGAYGAFSQETGKIYLAQELINSNSTDLVSSVLLEEYGHYLDTQLNVGDSSGDEGAIFSSVVQGKSFEFEQLQQLKSRDDTATITLDGQLVQIEQAPTVSESGNKGGNKKKFFTLDPLPQGITERNVTLTYQYEHFSIPDQFELSYGSTSLFSTQRVVSGSKTGSVVFKQVQGRNTVDIKVTAETDGTAWNFTVSDKTAEINVNGKLGDVIKIDLGKQKGNLALKSLPDASKGKLIDEKGGIATVGTSYKVLYYVPKVTGAIQTYGKDRTGDLGLGQVNFDVVDQDQKSLNVKVSVTDGFSTTGSNTVKVEKGKLNLYTQQQRLAYLGFPGSSGNPLVVDGNPGGNTTWAIKLFNIATNPAVFERGNVVKQAEPDKFFKAYINSANAPKWQLLTTVPRLTIFSDERRNYGMDRTGKITENALATLGLNLKSTGSAKNIGTAPPSTSHDGGRGIDIEDVEGNFFRSSGLYVASPGGKIIVTNGTSYQAANLKNIPQGFKGLLTETLRSQTNDVMVKAIANLLDYKLDKAKVQKIIDAFKGAGSGRILYNDPRLTGVFFL